MLNKDRVGAELSTRGEPTRSSRHDAASSVEGVGSLRERGVANGAYASSCWRTAAPDRAQTCSDAAARLMAAPTTHLS